MAAKKSLSTSASPQSTMDRRATSTNSTGWVNSARCRRNASRNNRRARLRMTAPPIFRLLTTPSRVTPPATNRRQLAIRQPCTARCPSRRVRANSRPRFNRSERAKPRRLADAAAMATANQTGVRRLRPTRLRLRKMARPLLDELRDRKPCCRLRRIFDG